MRTVRTVATFFVSLVVALAVLSGAGQLRSFAGPSYEELALITNVLHLVRQHYVRDIEEHELVQGALAGMLDVLDPHTTYLNADLFRELRVAAKGEFFGLGIEITKRDGYVTVVAPIDGTPAARAGIRARDQIIAVCPDTTDQSCQSTQEMNLFEAVKLMRGPRGTKILIRILRKGWSTPRPFLIVRDAIQVPSVALHLVEPNLPYVRLTQFQERTARDLDEMLSAVEGPIRGLVLDLRDNPGGLLDQAVKVADLFLDDGLIVFTKGRGEGNRMEWHAHTNGTQQPYPVVVLVNGGSASASEIVAGSLQDHRRALLVGTETFGKGSVQTIIPLDDGSGLRLTTALYYLPSGRSIQEVRIQPDITIEPFSEAQLKALMEEEGDGVTTRLGEEHLPGHLSSETEPEEEPVDRDQDFADRMERDRQLTRALDLLKSWNVFSKLEGSEGT